jgi:hypothetical protein
MKNEEVQIIKVIGPSFERELQIRLKTDQIIRVGHFDSLNEPKAGTNVRGYLKGLGEVEKIYNESPRVIISNEPYPYQVLDIIGTAKNPLKRTIDIESTIHVTVEHKNMKQILKGAKISEGDMIHLSHPVEFFINIIKD